MRVDFGARSNSLDTARGLQSYGFLNNTESNNTRSAMVKENSFPEHIVSNVNFQNIRVQLLDSSGNPLVATDTNNATQQPEDNVLKFTFIPID